MRQNVEEIYNFIVDDVVEKVQDVFSQEGIPSYVRTQIFADPNLTRFFPTFFERVRWIVFVFLSRFR